MRGVIAAESATCSREGGALIPTIVFGVPGSAGMAILLGAFLMHGLVPGPDMLTKNLDITYAMVWSIAVANILGSGLCFLFSSQFAKLASLRYTLILPMVLSLDLYRRLRRPARLGRSVFTAVLRRVRLDRKTLQMAAAAFGAGLHPRQHPRALSCSSRSNATAPVDAASGRHRPVPDGG